MKLNFFVVLLTIFKKLHRLLQEAHVLKFAIIFIIISLGVLIRIPPDETIRNIDEVIARDVVGSMHDRGSFNSDWNMVNQVLPHEFGKFRYNFSSYLIISSLLVPVTDNNDLRLEYLRYLNLIFYTVSALVLWNCVIRLGISIGNGFLALILFSLAPGLVHDSMMARPESYMTFLVLIYFWACILTTRAMMTGSIVAGFILGLLIATKFTMGALIILFLLIIVFLNTCLTIRARLIYLFVFIISLVAGFASGSPFAFLDFSGFMQGVNNLRVQY